MCYQKVKSYNRSRFLNLVFPQRYVQYFNCGRCFDCIESKRQEYQFRAYFQAVDTFNQPNSFVLFDTLTYDDFNLKSFRDIAGVRFYTAQDFSCFSRSDVKKFFKRLRISLVRAGYDIDGKLKYFLTSEYGHDNVYFDSKGRKRKGTKRPHYHVLFYVTFNIDPLVFSEFISNAWNLGRTDGVVYKGKPYVLYNRVFRNNSVHLMRLYNYVGKYVTKDFVTYDKLYKRVYDYYIHFIDPKFMDSYKGRLAFRRFKNQVLPFHLSSVGFGLYGVTTDKDFIMSSGMVRIVNGKRSGVSTIPLPLYYRRKLYFYTDYFNGSLRWRLNDLGKREKWLRLNDNVNRLANDLIYQRFVDDYDRALSISWYNYLWKGLFINKMDLDLSNYDLFLRLNDDRNYLVDFYRDYDLVLYNHNTEYFGYHRGKNISSVYQSKYIDIKGRVGYFSSLAEFEKQPFVKDYIIVSSFTVKRFDGYDGILQSYYNNLFNISYGSTKYQKRLSQSIDRIRSVYQQILT